MAAKKKTKAAAPRRRSAAAPRKSSRRSSTGVKEIPAAGMTIGIIAANAAPITTAVTEFSIQGMKNAARQAIQPEQLKKTAAYAIGGAIAGYAVKQFAPKFIKKPLGMAAKKIKAVF